MVRLFPLFILFLISCSSLERWAVRRASPVFVKAGDELTREDSWEFFRTSAPGNVKLVELLYLTDPSNMTLLPAVIKAYAGYAFAVPETLAFGDALAGKEDSPHVKEAITLYTRALDYGVTYLESRGVKRKDLLSLSEDDLKKLLGKKIDEDDFVALVYFAQAWGSLINLQKDNVALVSQIPRVKILFDHVCKKAPKIEHEICAIFYAQYEGSRPRMVGGSPERARELYLKARKENPHHLLIPLGLIQYVVIPAMEGEEYETLAQELRKEFSDWENRDRSELRDSTPYRKIRELNLYNAVARKRFELIEQNKKNIF